MNATEKNEFSNLKDNNAFFLKRFYIYQKERFPFLAHGLLIAAFSFSAISYSRICRGAEGFIQAKTFIAGIAVTVSLFFLVRIFDEFKDAKDDALYRKELPVPRGLVSFRELAYMAVIVVLFQLALNIIFFPKMLIIYGIIFLYLMLMTKEFFISSWLKKHQFWYVVSHMFIIPLVDIYASGLDWFLANAKPSKGLFFFFAVSYMNGIVLEIGRKIRAPQKESKGVLSYTYLLGTNRAVIFWMSIIFITLLLSIAASSFAGYGLTAYIILAIIFFICCMPAIFFLRRKSVQFSKMIEYASALWTIAMYLTLGGVPMISKFFNG